MTTLVRIGGEWHLLRFAQRHDSIWRWTEFVGSRPATSDEIQEAHRTLLVECPVLARAAVVHDVVVHIADGGLSEGCLISTWLTGANALYSVGIGTAEGLRQLGYPLLS